MIKVANEIKKIKADRLVSITSIKDGEENTIYYHFSFDKKPEIKEYKVEVQKDEEVESAIELFENAALLEAEITELFGVKFHGNPFCGKRLFQAEGKRKPPMCIGK